MYVLDANVFIEAKNHAYGFDLCPGFWTWLDEAHVAGRACSVEKVHEELRAGGDDLATWADARSSFFVSPDNAVVQSLRTLAVWAPNAGYERAAVNTFLAAGDAFLVAHAHAHHLTVVTHEVSAPASRKIKVPDACQAHGVAHSTPYVMLRGEGARFVLEA